MVLVLTPPILLLMTSGLYHLFDQVIERRLTLGDVVLLMSYGAMLARPMVDLGAHLVLPAGADFRTAPGVQRARPARGEFVL